MIGLNIRMSAFWEQVKDYMIVPCASLPLSLSAFLPQIIQYQTVRYDTLPLSPISRNRLRKFPHPVLLPLYVQFCPLGELLTTQLDAMLQFIEDSESCFVSKSVSKHLFLRSDYLTLWVELIPL